MKCRDIISACAFIAASIGFAAPAMATPSTANYILDTWRGSGTVSGNDFGTVFLQQIGANVEVTVTPASGNGFVNTGAGYSLLFDLNGISSITIAGVTTGFSASKTTGGITSASSYGSGSIGTDFNYAIQCDACGNGGSNVQTGPLDFTIDGISLADFQANDNGNYFASDLCIGTITTTSVKKGTTVTTVSCGGTPGVTGNVTAEFDPPTVPVPEPLTLSLFGAGLAGAFAARRRKKA